MSRPSIEQIKAIVSFSELQALCISLARKKRGLSRETDRRDGQLEKLKLELSMQQKKYKEYVENERTAALELLTDELERTTKESKQLEARKQGYVTQVQEVCDKVCRAEDQLLLLKRELEAIPETLATQRAKLAEKQIRIQELQKELQEKSNTKTHLLDDLKEYEETEATLKAKLANIEKKRRETASKFAERKAKGLNRIRQLEKRQKSARAQYEKEVADMNSELEDAKKQIAYAKSQLAKIQEEKAETQKQTQREISELKEMKEQLHRSYEEVQHAKQQEMVEAEQMKEELMREIEEETERKNLIELQSREDNAKLESIPHISLVTAESQTSESFEQESLNIMPNSLLETEQANLSASVVKVNDFADSVAEVSKVGASHTDLGSNYSKTRSLIVSGSQEWSTIETESHSTKKQEESDAEQFNRFDHTSDSLFKQRSHADKEQSTPKDGNDAEVAFDSVNDSNCGFDPEFKNRKSIFANDQRELDSRSSQFRSNQDTVILSRSAFTGHEDYPDLKAESVRESATLCNRTEDSSSEENVCDDLISKQRECSVYQTKPLDICAESSITEDEALEDSLRLQLQKERVSHQDHVVVLRQRHQELSNIIAAYEQNIEQNMILYEREIQELTEEVSRTEKSMKKSQTNAKILEQVRNYLNIARETFSMIDKVNQIPDEVREQTERDELLDAQLAKLLGFDDIESETIRLLESLKK